MKRLFAVFALLILPAILGGIGAVLAQQPVSERIQAVAWSPDGSQIAVGSSEGIRIFDDQLTEVAYIDVLFSPGLAWSPDGTKLAFFHNVHDEDISQTVSLVEIWEVATLTPTIPPFKTFQPGKLSWSPDGTRLMVNAIPIETQAPNTILYQLDIIPILDTSTGQIVEEIPVPQQSFSSVYDVAWSPDGQYVAISGVDALGASALGFWDTTSSEMSFASEVVERATVLAWNSTGTQIAYASWSGIVIWDVAAEQTVNIIPTEDQNISTLDWNDGVIAASDTPSADRLFVKTWEATTGELLQEIAVSGTVYSVALSPDATHLIYGAADSALEVVDVPEVTACDPAFTSPTATQPRSLAPSPPSTAHPNPTPSAWQRAAPTPSQRPTEVQTPCQKSPAYSSTNPAPILLFFRPDVSWAG